MRAVVVPEVAYGATAVRPGWGEVPAEVRAAVAGRLGAAVVAVESAGGGFTRAFAAVLRLGDGRSVFVKAAPEVDPVAGFYARESVVTAALPPGVPAARPLWAMAVHGWFVLCLRAVAGRVPELPWKRGELDAALAAWSAASAALADPPAELAAVGVPRMSDIVRDEMSWWSEIDAGRERQPDAPGWVAGRLPELAALEAALPGHVEGAGVLHGDLRVDNVLITADGSAVLCDWTWPCLGAPWFDAVTLLVSAFASGHDADALLAPWSAPSEGVDGALAALGGYWLVRAASGPSSASPHSRQHQLFSGTQAMTWLATRRGWVAG